MPCLRHRHHISIAAFPPSRRVDAKFQVGIGPLPSNPELNPIPLASRKSRSSNSACSNHVSPSSRARRFLIGHEKRPKPRGQADRVRSSVACARQRPHCLHAFDNAFHLPPRPLLRRRRPFGPRWRFVCSLRLQHRPSHSRHLSEPLHRDGRAHHKRARRAAVHPLPYLQRDRPPPRALLWHRKRHVHLYCCICLLESRLGRAAH